MIPRQLLTVLGAAVEPLEAVLDTPEVLDGVLADVGIVVALTDAQRDAIAVIAGLDAFAGMGDLVAAARSTTQLDAQAVARLTGAVTVAVDGFGALADGSADLGDLPAPLDDTATWGAVLHNLPDALLSRAIEGLAPTVSALLTALRVLRVDPGTDGLPGRRWIDWALLGDVLGGDWGAVPASYGWGAEAFDANDTIAVLADVAGRAGLSAQRDFLDTEIANRYSSVDLALRQLEMTFFHGSTGTVAGSVAAAIVPVPAVDADGVTPAGFVVINRSTVDAGATIDVSDTWQLDVSGDLHATVLPTIELQPGKLPALEQGGASATVAATLSGAPAGQESWLLIGERDGIRVELAAASIGAEASLGDPAAALVAELTGLRFTTDTSAADSFLANVVGLLPIDFDTDVAVEWSSAGNLAFRGSAGLDIPIGGDIVLGPLRVTGIQLSVELGGSITIIAAGTITLTIGDVFEASIIGMGMRVVITIQPSGSGGSAGGLSVAVEFEPPYRVEFVLDAGPVTGEGFVERTDDRYVGGLSLDVVALGIDAFTIIDVSLSGDPDGFALFATLTLRFPSIPLGFGFSLSGLGGLLALNRAVDTEALALGLRDGAADAILFPENFLRDADLLVAQIDEYFPILDGNTVVGPVAEIRWGVGDILIGQLGVAISLPQGLILVLASIEAVLPDRDAPALELHLDVLGVLDIEEGTLLIVGSLYDSRLLGVIELSGDSALYLSWGDDPYFVMSVGGFHPGFTPPAHVPAILEELRPMRAEVHIGDGVTAAIEAYFAVTSNTVQFGGGFEIEASAEFLLVTYTARGWFDFDVLLQFAPFVILAQASAGVGVYANDKELLGVSLSVHLEGPEPWYACGDATFKFFGINVKFDFAVGGHAPPELRGSSDVLDLVRIELSNPAAWTVQHPSGTPSGLVLAGERTDDLVRPDDLLVGRQTVAPLERTLARFGEATPLQSNVSVAATTVVSMVDGIEGASIGELDVADALDWFAPAQFDVMADQARLSSPSYQQMIAGVSVGGSAVGLPGEPEIVAPEGHETEVWEPTTNSFERFDVVIVAARSLDDVVLASFGAAASTKVGAAVVDMVRVELTGQRYVVADATSGAHLSEELSYSAAVAAASSTTGSRVVPAHAGSVR
ncbi:MAG: DUF6603 domain-containing protein [Ilumatobacteraceae bacterium]